MADVEDMQKPKAQMHGFSGVLLVAIDTALWIPNVGTFGSLTPVVCFLAFVFAGAGVFLVQKYMSEDDTGLALTKGFVVGVLAGVPTPVLGGLGGTYVMGKAMLRAISGKS